MDNLINFETMVPSDANQWEDESFELGQLANAVSRTGLAEIIIG